jgi:two-component sensor histidine kinase
MLCPDNEPRRGSFGDMSTADSPYRADDTPDATLESPEHRTVASYERELTRHRSTEIRLRDALAREEALLRQKDELIQQKELMSKESDHRLLNGLQMIVSLLSLQSRASANVEAASQLAAAADRVAMIARVHRRLHYLDGVQTVAFKQYLEGLCRDFSSMLSSEEHSGQIIVVEGLELKLPSVTGIPLGFIVSELITNAAKYGNGRISVRLEPNPEKGYALSVSNDGPGLPDAFDPGVSLGLGMRIIRSLVKQIGGELRFGRSDNNQGARFAVMFSDRSQFGG